MLNKRVISIGNFDGVHLGHRRILEEARNLATEMSGGVEGRNKITTECLTFERLFSIPRGRILTTTQEKVELISQSGFVDEILLLPDNKKIWRMTAEDFVKEIIIKENPAGIVAGEDFRFGVGAKGDVDFLKKTLVALGYVGVIVRKLRDVKSADGKRISSSAIRELILSGRVSEARKMLGRFYSVRGEAIKGKGLAGRLGFPTVNLKIDEDKLLPAEGIFAGFASPVYRRSNHGKNKDRQILKAAVYIGNSPTLLGAKRKRFEFHIIGTSDGKGVNFFNNKKIKFWEVFLVEKIRDEKKFASETILKKAIKKDIMKIQNLPILKEAESL